MADDSFSEFQGPVDTNFLDFQFFEKVYNPDGGFLSEVQTGFYKSIDRLVEIFRRVDALNIFKNTGEMVA